MESIQEVLGEIDESNKAINDQASLHIHSNATILTYSSSKTILSFLISAYHKSKRRFKVVVAEGAPHYGGHVMAAKLSQEGIPVTVIHDAAVSAMMPRVDCVLLPAHAVLANGGVVAPSGSHLCALAAKANKVSTIVVSGLDFKLCPMYPHEGQVRTGKRQLISVLMDNFKC
jgi:translation initiation factor eIF-2B subunit beta